MTSVEETELKLGVAMEVLWKALTKDLKSVVPASMPEVIKEMKILEGDGSLDTVFLIDFNPDVPNITPQTEKVVELDESKHQIVLQVIEGGRMNLGFNFYKTTYQLNAIGDSDTLVNIKLEYEIESQEILAPGEAAGKLSVGFIQSLETVMKKQD